MTTVNLEFASELGKEFAAQLNSTPNDAQNWGFLNRGSDLPEFDYIEMKTHYGAEFDENIADIESEYRAGFNSVFVPINNPDSDE